MRPVTSLIPARWFLRKASNARPCRGMTGGGPEEQDRVLAGLQAMVLQQLRPDRRGVGGRLASFAHYPLPGRILHEPQDVRHVQLQVRVGQLAVDDVSHRILGNALINANNASADDQRDPANLVRQL